MAFPAVVLEGGLIVLVFAATELSVTRMAWRTDRPGAPLRARRRARRARLFIATVVAGVLGVLLPYGALSNALFLVAAALLVWALATRVPEVSERVQL